MGKTKLDSERLKKVNGGTGSEETVFIVKPGEGTGYDDIKDRGGGNIAKSIGHFRPEYIKDREGGNG